MEGGTAAPRASQAAPVGHQSADVKSTYCVRSLRLPHPTAAAPRFYKRKPLTRVVASEVGVQRGGVKRFCSAPDACAAQQRDSTQLLISPAFRGAHARRTCKLPAGALSCCCCCTERAGVLPLLHTTTSRCGAFTKAFNAKQARLTQLLRLLGRLAGGGGIRWRACGPAVGCPRCRQLVLRKEKQWAGTQDMRPWHVVQAARQLMQLPQASARIMIAPHSAAPSAAQMPMQHPARCPTARRTLDPRAALPPLPLRVLLVELVELLRGSSTLGCSAAGAGSGAAAAAGGMPTLLAGVSGARASAMPPQPRAPPAPVISTSAF